MPSEPGNPRSSPDTAVTVADPPQAKGIQQPESDRGPMLLPAMEHFVGLVRKVKRPVLLHTLLTHSSEVSFPTLAGMEDAACELPTAARKALFHAVNQLPGRVLHHLERVAERIALLDDAYGIHAIHSFLDPDTDGDPLKSCSDKHSRALALYLQQVQSEGTDTPDRRFDQAEQLQLLHRHGKNEPFSSHYQGPKGAVPRIDRATEIALRDRLRIVYPALSQESLVVESFTRRDLAMNSCDEQDTENIVSVERYTMTVTFNGSQTHYRKVEGGEVVCHDDLAAVSIRYSWDATRGILEVFSDDKENRRELATIFRDVILDCKGELHDLPMHAFDLSGFATPAILQRLIDERVEGIETISILHVTLARPFEQRAVVIAGGTRTLAQQVVSRLTIAQDQRDARTLYTAAYEDHALEDLTDYTLEQVTLVFRMAQQPYRPAHPITVQITAPNGLNTESKTEDDRTRVMAQLIRLGIVRTF